MPGFLRLLGGCLVVAALLRTVRRGPHLHRLLAHRRRPPPEPGGLPFALEVWAALLSAGQPTAEALGQAAACCGAELAKPLLQVRAGLDAGLPSAEAWALALRDAGSPTLMLAADACARTERDGMPLSPVLRRLAADLRATAASRGLVAARRAGVLAVLPLGLCTLPAYVLLSVAPAVIGLVRHAR